jgi:hypothetical protein
MVTWMCWRRHVVAATALLLTQAASASQALIECSFTCRRAALLPHDPEGPTLLHCTHHIAEQAPQPPLLTHNCPRFG